MVVPALEADKAIFGYEVPQYREMLGNTKETGEYWATGNATNDFLESNGDKFHFIGGWYDVFLLGTVKTYNQKRAQGFSPYLTIFNTDHSGFSFFMALKDTYTWLNYKLKGDNSLLRKKPVALQISPTKNWLYLDSWPPASSPLNLYLSKSAAVFGSQLTSAKNEVKGGIFFLCL